MRRLVTKWFGSVLLDGDHVVERRDFPPDARAIADRLAAMRDGKVLDEERALAAPGLAVHAARLRELGRLEKAGPLPPVPPPAHATTALLHQASLLVARDATRAAQAERDRHLVHTVRTFEELQKSINTLSERLVEWYGLHYPEAVAKAGGPEKLTALVSVTPSRAEAAKKLQDLHPEASVGVDMSPADLATLQAYAVSVQGLYDERNRLEKVIERDIKTVAPTLGGLLGPLLAAHLIAKANGLERLAYLPSGTVQTLGAETALFLHLREDKDPPKHGILFQHPSVHQSPPWNHGRIARTMANYASRAARIDHFHEPPVDRSPQLRPEMEKKINKLRARPRPAPKQQTRAPYRGGPPQRGPPPRGPSQQQGPPPRRPTFQPRPRPGPGSGKPFRRHG